MPISIVSRNVLVVKGYQKIDDVLSEQRRRGADSSKKIVHHSTKFERTPPTPLQGSVHEKFKQYASGLVEMSEQTYVATLDSVRIVGENPAVITPDSYIVNDLMSPHIPMDAPKHYLCHTVVFKKYHLLKGRSLLLSAPDAGYNYFHWMADALPKIEIAKKAGLDFATVDNFIVSDHDLAYQKETLEIFEIPKEKIISVKQLPYLLCEELVVTSPSIYAGNVPYWILEFLRNAFKTFLKKKSGCHRRLYITRKNASKRRLLNEAELVKQLENEGFVEMTTEGLSVAEQANLFYNAEMIVGVHGAGLTNLIFCNEGTKVVEIFPTTYINQSYYVISTLLKLEYYYIVSDGIDTTTRENHLIDTDFSLSSQNINSIINFTTRQSSDIF